MKASGLGDGYARDADGAGKVVGESAGEAAGVGSGRGCWIESEGRDSLEAWWLAMLGMLEEADVPQHFQRH